MEVPTKIFVHIDSGCLFGEERDLGSETDRNLVRSLVILPCPAKGVIEIYLSCWYRLLLYQSTIGLVAA